MRETKKTFSGTKSDLERFLLWECKEQNKRKNGFTVLDYFTGEKVTETIFKSKEEARQWSEVNLREKLKSNEIHNNLHIIKRV